MRRTPTDIRTRPALNPLTAAVAAALGSSLAVDVVQAQIRELPMEELIVTASRRESTVQDVPINITAISGDVLESQRIRSLTSFSRQVPGLTVVDQGPRASDLMVVRGLNTSNIDASEILGNGSGDTVSTYVGEIPLYVDLKMIDVERVEVLIGPQGTLYGRGTLGGAVRYVPNRPDVDEFGFEAHADVFNVTESDSMGYETDLAVNVPIVEDKLAFRGVVAYVDDPGYIDYPYLVREPGVSNPQPDFSDPADVAANLVSANDVDFEETLATRLMLSWLPTNSLELLFGYHYQDQDVGGRSINHRHSFGTGPYESASRFLEPNDRENQLLTMEIIADLGFAELTSATGYSQYDELGQRDQTDLLLSFDLSGAGLDYAYENFPAFVAFTREYGDEKRISQELRLVSTGGGPWNWIAGVFYNESDFYGTSEEFTPGYPAWADANFGLGIGGLPTGDLEYLAIEDTVTEEAALFGEVGYQITDEFSVTVGARWFDYDVNQSVSISLPFAPFLDFEGQNQAADDGVLGKVNFSYQPTDNITAYFTWSEGYRIGGVNPIATCPDPVPPTQNICIDPDLVLIKPDTTQNTEIGVKSGLLDGRLTLNAAIFNIDWDDLQTDSVTEVGAQPITVNGGTANTRGVELSFRAAGDGPFSFWGSYAYANAELTEDAPGLVRGVDAFDGDRLSGSPEHMASFNLNYFRSLGNGWDLDVNYGLTYTSDVYTKVGLRDNGEALDGYTLHSASLAFSRDSWSAVLYADNLTDELAETGVRRDPTVTRDVGVNDFTVRQYFRNVVRPRTIGVEFRYAL